MKPTPEQAREFLETDQVNVAARLKAGGTLTNSERAMYAKIAESKPAYAPDAPPATPVSPPTHAPTPDVSHEATAEQIARWETLYGTRRRQLFRYLATGREKARPCPLDHPARMPEWWGICMRQRVPPKILAVAMHAARESGTPVQPSAPSAPVTTPPPPAAAFDFPAQVARLRAEQQRIQSQLDTARAGTKTDGALTVNQADCESLLRQSLALTGELRKAENDLTTWLTSRELLCDTAAVRAENARIAGAITAAVRRLVRTVRPLLAGVSEADADRIWKEKTETCFAALKVAKFTKLDAASQPTESITE